MSDNVRFHSKWHGKNHHTNSTPGYYDSGVDPIAAAADPFMGNFHLSGAHHLYQYVYSGGAWSLQEGIISAGTWLGVESLYHTAVAASAGWGGADSVYTTINSLSSVWQPVGGDVGDYDSTSSGELFTLNSVCVGGTDPNIYSGETWKFKVVGDTVIVGSLSATGGTTYLDTTVSQVSAIHAVANTASGGAPALKVTQNGAANIVNMFRNGNVEVFTILENGNVGIGTAAPSQRLHVKNPTNASNEHCWGVMQTSNIDAAAAWTFDDSTNRVTVGLSQTSNTLALVHNGTGNYIADSNLGININAAGNVGIGTTAPGTELEVGDGTGSEAITINKSTGGTGTLYFDNAGANKVYFQADADEHLRIATNNSVAMSILESGNVGIGTTSPLDLLHVSTGNNSDSGNVAIRIGGSDDSNARTAELIKNTSTPYEFTIRGSNYSGGNTIYFETAPGVPRLTILNDGNVGIGTTAPGALLHIDGDDNDTTIGSKQRILMENDSTTASAGSEFVFSTGNTNVETYGAVGTAIVGNDGATGSRGRVYIATKTNSADTTLTERLVVLEGGNVGIGTTSPTAKLQVNGTAASSALHFDVNDGVHNLLRIQQTGGDQKEVVFNEDSTDMDFRIESDASTHAFFLEGSSGNVGIGTGAAVPEVKLEVDHDGAVTSFTGDQNQGIRITMVGGSNDEYCLLGFGGTQDKDIARIGCKQTSSGSILQFGTSNNYANSVTNTAMTIDTVGNVGIGVTAPTNKLEVGGSLYVTSSITAAADIIAYYSSDARLKENVTRIDNALDKVTKLNGYTFTWNDKIVRPADFHNEVEVGVIAQEVQEVLPEIVKERATGYLAIKYEQLTPLLIEAIKELKESNDKLQSRIEELERK